MSRFVKLGMLQIFFESNMRKNKKKFGVSTYNKYSEDSESFYFDVRINHFESFMYNKRIKR